MTLAEALVVCGFLMFLVIAGDPDIIVKIIKAIRGTPTNKD